MSTRSRRSKVDWNDFYRNGIPKEVIVIDDDDSPERQPTHGHDNSYERHPDKKRKTGGSSNYDPVYSNPQPSYSTTHTPYYDNSSANHTVSTDRTAPAHKGTGSTSTGPSITNGSYNPNPEGVAGQKRKRTTRAVEESKSSKRREIDRNLSPFSAYIPPPKPPIKAKDVTVMVIKDVSCPSSADLPATYHQQTKPLKEKCDDPDGHYIVETNSDLTQRCKSCLAE